MCVRRQTYRELLALPDADPTYHLFAACCLFYLGLYKEADAEAQRGPATRLQNRILFQISHKLGDEVCRANSRPASRVI